MKGWKDHRVDLDSPTTMLLLARLPQPGPAPLLTALCYETKVPELQHSVWLTSNICSTPWPLAPAFLLLFSWLKYFQVIFQTRVEIKFFHTFYQTERFIANLHLLLNFLTESQPARLSIPSVCLLHCRNKLSLTLASTNCIKTSFDIFKSNKKNDKRKFYFRKILTL